MRLSRGDIASGAPAGSHGTAPLRPAFDFDGDRGAHGGRLVEAGDYRAGWTPVASARLAGVHYARGEDASEDDALPDALPDAPRHEMAIALGSLKPGDVKAWSTKRPGTWPLANGVTLEVRGKIFHGTDVQTTARFRWPDGRIEGVPVAADFFANREPWAIAWDAGATSLWIAAGEPVAPGSAAPAAPAPAAFIQKIDFADPLRIERSSFTAWPEKGAPSEACRAEMAKYFTVEGGGELSSQRLGWVSDEPGDGCANLMAIALFVGKDGSFRVDEEEVASAHDDRAQAVQKLRAAMRKQAQNLREHYPRRDPDPASAAPPTVVSIFAAEEVPFKYVSEAVGACQGEGLESRISTRQVSTDQSSVRGVPLSGEKKSVDITAFDDLYEPAPDRPGEVQRKASVFFMSLGKVGPWLYYPTNADHFYLEVRPDPEVVEDVVYGPINGNPVDKLDLADWLRESPNHSDPGYARRVARDMLRCDDVSLVRIAINWIGTFGVPSPPDEYAGLGTALDDFIARFPESLVIEEARIAGQIEGAT